MPRWLCDQITWIGIEQKRLNRLMCEVAGFRTMSAKQKDAYLRQAHYTKGKIDECLDGLAAKMAAWGHQMAEDEISLIDEHLEGVPQEVDTFLDRFEALLAARQMANTSSVLNLF